MTEEQIEKEKYEIAKALYIKAVDITQGIALNGITASQALDAAKAFVDSYSFKKN